MSDAAIIRDDQIAEPEMPKAVATLYDTRSDFRETVRWL